MDQTRVESFIEQTANISTGFVLSWLVMEFVILSLIAWGLIALDDTTAIISVFTVTSFIRGYLWRRFFARGFHARVHKFVTQKLGSVVGPSGPIDK